MSAFDVEAVDSAISGRLQPDVADADDLARKVYAGSIVIGAYCVDDEGERDWWRLAEVCVNARRWRIYTDTCAGIHEGAWRNGYAGRGWRERMADDVVAAIPEALARLRAEVLTGEREQTPSGDP